LWNSGGASSEDVKPEDGVVVGSYVDPRPTESMVAAAVQWAERIMKKIDGVYRQ